MDLFLNEEQLKQAVNNVAVTEDGLKLLGHYISLSRINTKRTAHDALKDAYNRGYSDFGLEIIQDLELYAFDKYVALQTTDINNKLREFKETNKNGK